MRKTTSRAARALKATKIQLRLRPAQKSALVRAARLRQETLSNFMLEHACAAAEQILADQVETVLPTKDWTAFCAALDGPPRSIAALKNLFSQPSAFDGRG